uniref:Uncharacterized protein n=1 Tax=uncultured marine group II/III euryarchaeote AD1000_20_C05 TaxID=1457735 RepID=A0A075FL07_9EURY|nr:hypothetical protein [uncultured marine group II/III euryarchaeote AD1000_20_C05]
MTSSPGTSCSSNPATRLSPPWIDPASRYASLEISPASRRLPSVSERKSTSLDTISDVSEPCEFNLPMEVSMIRRIWFPF